MKRSQESVTNNISNGTFNGCSKMWLCVDMTCMCGAEGASFDDRMAFLAEATLMKDCEHENVLGLVAAFIKEGQPFVVLPLMENGDIKKFISNPNNVGQHADAIFSKCTSKSCQYFKTLINRSE